MFVSLWLALGTCPGAPLVHAPAPVDNPLKGLVPYVSADAVDRFPHSLEFRYFGLDEVMKGRGRFDWSVVEETLAITAKRGCQLVMRVHVEYPGQGDRIPPFLIKEGIAVTRWKGKGGRECVTPDYEDPRVRLALREFITAFGATYDGDPRIGFVTAGLLGSWGEWHTWPREDLWASREVQEEVMAAYERAFRSTPVLLRYPAGPGSGRAASNVERPFGYHDDSFCWATLDTGRREDRGQFLAQMRTAGANEKWKRFPIGGELRPELWVTSFTDQHHPRDQGFRKCVEAAHVTWVMDSGLFAGKFPLSTERRARALEEVRRMGYEYHVAEAELDRDGLLALTVENRGVAPFYADWPVELASAGGDVVVRRSGLTTGILPGERKVWTFRVAPNPGRLRLRIPNPMKGGRPLRFANKEQGKEWLLLEF